MASPVIRCWSDATSLLTSFQWGQWLNHETKKGLSSRIAWQSTLVGCGGTKTVNEILTEIGLAKQIIAEQIEAKTGQVIDLSQYQDELFLPKSLSEANLAYANELFSEAPLDWVRKVAGEVGVRQDLAELQLRAATALVTAGIVSKTGELLPVFVDRQLAVSGAAGSFWSKFSSGWKKLFQNPGEWAQRVFITEPGKALKWAGKQLASLSKNQWTSWLIDPTGILKLIGVFLEEIGHAAVEGSISAFDERRVLLAAAEHWGKVGILLTVASTFLPPPWDVVGLAVGAAFTTAGQIVQNTYAIADNTRAAEDRAKLAAQKAADARAFADSQAFSAFPMAAETNLKQGLDLRPIAGLGLAALVWSLYA